MSDNEIGVEEVHEECKLFAFIIKIFRILVEQMKQSAKRKKGRGFTTNEASGDRGAYDTLKGDGKGPQRSIDVR
jgi:hypothetical protein